VTLFVHKVNWTITLPPGQSHCYVDASPWSEQTQSENRQNIVRTSSEHRQNLDLNWDEKTELRRGHHFGKYPLRINKLSHARKYWSIFM